VGWNPLFDLPMEEASNFCRMRIAPALERIMAWNSNYSVGVKRCDEDHQKLFALIDDLHEAMRDGKGSEIAQSVVKELEHYTRVHFSAEEALMVRTKYPGLAAHQVEHQKFVDKVAHFRTELKEGTAGQAIQISMFMNDWLIKHIKQTDQRYSAHLNAHGVS
jgi:hemerythrin